MKTMARVLTSLLAVLSLCRFIQAATPLALPPAVVAQLNTAVTANLKSAGINAAVTINVAGYTPVVISPSNATAAATQATTQPTYYISLTGNDTAAGTSPATAWQTPRVVDNATVFLTAGQKFPIPLNTPLNFSSHQNATVTTDPANPATLLGAAGGGIDHGITNFWTNTTGCTLANVIVDSVDGNGYAGDVRGPNNAIVNVLLNNLNEGFQYKNACDNLKIIGGGQIGKVSGRCHYLLDVTHLTWTGDPNRVFGPAQTQSPIRFSCPGVRGGTITGVRVTQVGSNFPIACWAIHAASGVSFINCQANGGEFSFDTAGGLDTAGMVNGCTISGLHTINTLLDLRPAAVNNQFINCDLNNSAGVCVAVAGGRGNSITGTTMTSPVGGAHFYAASDAVLKNCTLNTLGHASAKWIDGSLCPANDGGGNSAK
jgi:hypothetical protein